MDLQDVGWEGMDWIDLACTCNCGNEPSGSIKFGEFLDWLRTSHLLQKDYAPWNVSKLNSVVKSWKGLIFCCYNWGVWNSGKQKLIGTTDIWRCGPTGCCIKQCCYDWFQLYLYFNFFIFMYFPPLLFYFIFFYICFSVVGSHCVKFLPSRTRQLPSVLSWSSQSHNDLARELLLRGMWPCIWMRHCATSWKIAGSVPDCVRVMFQWQSFRPRYGSVVNPAPNRNENQEYFLGAKGGWHIGLWQPYPLLEIWEPRPSGNLRACPGL